MHQDAIGTRDQRPNYPAYSEIDWMDILSVFTSESVCSGESIKPSNAVQQVPRLQPKWGNLQTRPYLPVYCCHYSQRYPITAPTNPTPPDISKTIGYGFTTWLTPQTTWVRPHTAGSVKPANTYLTFAFHEQFYSLTWYQFCSGRISCLWSKAAHYQSDPGLSTPTTNTFY